MFLITVETWQHDCAAGIVISFLPEKEPPLGQCRREEAPF